MQLISCLLLWFLYPDGDESNISKKQKQAENLRKRALNSDILQDLKDQYHDGPVEIRVN